MKSYGRKKRRQPNGFTLIELVLVVVIIGILVAVGVKKIGPITQSGKIEETKAEMNALAAAITGNSELENNGVRSDFGYVGDVGAMPPDLDALYSNPGGYSTWKGPYIKNSFEQVTGDYNKDAWQTDYSFSGGVSITSTGLGSNIIRNLAGSVNYLLYNRVTGNVFDLDGTPPGPDYGDSILIRLTIPDGSGGLVINNANPDQGGYFSFDSIPIGNHNIEIIYEPDDDTLRRFVSVLPNSSPYSQYNLLSDILFDPAAASTDSTLMGHWKLNETGGTLASDASGNGNDGTLTNMDPANDWITGKVDGALDFSGGDDYVVVSNSASLQIADSLTIAGWVWGDSWGSGSEVDIIARKGTSTPVNYQLAIADRQVSLMLDDMDGGGGIRGATTLNIGEWYHVAGVWDGSVVRIYLNGVLDNNPPDARGGNIGTDTRPLYIGGRSGQDLLDGRLDDIRIYNRALSAAEILALYNLGS